MNEADFAALCDRHDLTYEYSDDASVWRRGANERAVIEAVATSLPAEVVARIWNEMVDKKLIPACRADFYWKAKAEAAS